MYIVLGYFNDQNLQIKCTSLCVIVSRQQVVAGSFDSVDDVHQYSSVEGDVLDLQPCVHRSVSPGSHGEARSLDLNYPIVSWCVTLTGKRCVYTNSMLSQNSGFMKNIGPAPRVFSL